MKGFIEVNAKRVNGGTRNPTFQATIFAASAISSIVPVGKDNKSCYIHLHEISSVDEHGNPSLVMYQVNEPFEVVRERLAAALE